MLAAKVLVGIGIIWFCWLKVTAIGTMLFMNHGVAHGTVGVIEQTKAGLLNFAVILIFFKQTRLYEAGFIFLFLAGLVHATVDQGGYPYSEYTVAAPDAIVRLPHGILPLVMFLRFKSYDAEGLRLKPKAVKSKTLQF